MRQAALDAGDTREIHVLGFAVDHVAEHELTDLFGVDLGAADGLLDHLAREFGRGDIFQSAAVITDRRAHAAEYDNFASVIHENLRN